MFKFRFLNLNDAPWNRLDIYPGRTIFKTRFWLTFLEASQDVTPVVIEILHDGRVAGYFTGAIFTSVTHWIQVSRFSLLITLRNRAQQLVRGIQRLRGRLASASKSV